MLNCANLWSNCANSWSKPEQNRTRLWSKLPFFFLRLINSNFKVHNKKKKVQPVDRTMVLNLHGIESSSSNLDRLPRTVRTRGAEGFGPDRTGPDHLQNTASHNQFHKKKKTKIIDRVGSWNVSKFSDVCSFWNIFVISYSLTVSPERNCALSFW